MGQPSAWTPTCQIGPELLNPSKKSVGPILQFRVLKLDKKIQLRELTHAKIVKFHIIFPIVFPVDFGPGVLRPLAQKGQKLTTLPHLKGMDLLKKVTNMNLSFFNGKFLVLNKVFDILNF